jgi:hypothetical protein
LPCAIDLNISLRSTDQDAFKMDIRKPLKHGSNASSPSSLTYVKRSAADHFSSTICRTIPSQNRQHQTAFGATTRWRDTPLPFCERTCGAGCSLPHPASDIGALTAAPSSWRWHLPAG